MCKLTPENIMFNKIRTLCEERSYIFHGWFGEYKGNRTYLDLENPETGNRWHTTAIRHFLSGSGDPSIRGGHLNRKEDSYHISRFLMTGVFPKGYKFKKNLTKKDARGTLDYWDCICPNCSNDRYVEDGACSGIFTSITSTLAKGTLPCRCSPSHKYNLDEAIVLAKITCEYYNGKYLNYVGVYEGVDKLKIEWIRPDGVQCHVLLRDLRRGKTSINGNGFDQTKPASLYITRWFGYGESYLKFGITNRSVITRIEEQASKAKLDYEILYEYKHDLGSTIADIERECKQHFTTGVCQRNYLPDGFSETIEDTYDNINYILNLIDNSLK